MNLAQIVGLGFSAVLFIAGIIGWLHTKGLKRVLDQGDYFARIAFSLVVLCGGGIALFVATMLKR